MVIKTIDEISREYLDETAKFAREKFRDAVRPIYGVTERSNPDQIGSGLLLELPEGRFLLTAAHVLDHNGNTSLYLGGDDFALLQFEALASRAPEGDRTKDHADFAIARLDSNTLGKLVGAKFITEAEISRSVALAPPRAYACLGYPNSKNKIKPHHGLAIVPKLLTYTSTGAPASQLMAIANDELHVLVSYNAKYARDEDGKKVNAIKIQGCSGGAIVDLGPISPDALADPPDPKLAALLIEGHAAEKVILGTRLTAILAAARKHSHFSPDVKAVVVPSEKIAKIPE